MLAVSELIKITCSFCEQKRQDFAPFESWQRVGETVLLEATHSCFGVIAVSDSFTPRCCSRDKAQFTHPTPFNERG